MKCQLCGNEKMLIGLDKMINLYKCHGCGLFFCSECEIKKHPSSGVQKVLDKHGISEKMYHIHCPKCSSEVDSNNWVYD